MNRQLYLLLAWLVALSSLLATLYASQVLHWPVCHLCWYQRISLYPLVILLGIGAYTNDAYCIKYAIAFPIMGFFFAAYQYLEQMILGFSPINFCSQGVQCSDIHLKLLGFITLPFLSALACALIFSLLLAAKK